MTREVRLQIAAGLGSVLALPLLYIGLHQDVGVLTALGFLVFAVSMAVTPVLRLRRERASR